MNNINPLTDDGLRFLSDRLTDIRVALEDLRLEPQRGEAPVIERCERILPSDLFNELRAYLGSIEAHHEAICDLLYGSGTDLRVDGLVIDPERCAVCGQPDNCGDCNHTPIDECPPHGIVVSDEVARARVVYIDDIQVPR